MNIYHVERTDGDGGYDTYSDFVVVAKSPLGARKTDPADPDKEVTETDTSRWGEWVTLSNTKATLIGKASPKFTAKVIICASFHQG